MVGRGLTMACAACGQRRLFRRWFSMQERCPRCGLLFERIEGHWIGAIGINTILSFATLAVSIIIGLIIILPDGDASPLVVAAVVVSIVAPTVFFPISRTFWTAIDIAMRPLEAHEVDWTVVDPHHRQDQTSPDQTNPDHTNPDQTDKDDTPE